MQQTRITGYQVMYSANRFPPRIWLSDETGSIGQLVFHANAETLPEDGLQGATPSLHYHLDDFHNALDCCAAPARSGCCTRAAAAASRTGCARIW